MGITICFHGVLMIFFCSMKELTTKTPPLTAASTITSASSFPKKVDLPMDPRALHSHRHEHLSDDLHRFATGRLLGRRPSQMVNAMAIKTKKAFPLHSRKTMFNILETIGMICLLTLFGFDGSFEVLALFLQISVRRRCIKDFVFITACLWFIKSSLFQQLVTVNVFVLHCSGKRMSDAFVFVHKELANKVHIIGFKKFSTNIPLFLSFHLPQKEITLNTLTFYFPI